MAARSHIRSRLALPLTLAFGLALSVAACGSTSSPTASAATASGGPVATSTSTGPAPTGGNTGAYDVCGLLKAGDLQLSFGVAMHVAQSLPPAGWTAGSCRWEAADMSTPKLITIEIGTGATMASANIVDPTAWIDSVSAKAATTYGSAVLQPVAGLGDKALFAGTGTKGQLTFCRRSTCAQVVVLGIGRDAVIALGKASATNL